MLPIKDNYIFYVPLHFSLTDAFLICQSLFAISVFYVILSVKITLLSLYHLQRGKTDHERGVLGMTPRGI